MEYCLSPKSETILSTVKRPLQDVIHRVVPAFPYQLIVDRGLCTAEQEMALWLKSHWPDGTDNGQPHLTGCNGYPKGTLAPNGCIGTGLSNHQGGDAADIVVQRDGEIIWNGEDPVYRQLNDAMMKAAAELNIKIEWGGNFLPPSKPDWDHWSLINDGTNAEAVNSALT